MTTSKKCSVHQCCDVKEYLFRSNGLTCYVYIPTMLNGSTKAVTHRSAIDRFTINTLLTFLNCCKINKLTCK